MENQTHLVGVNARIREDYGILDSCIEYMATFLLCWSKKEYREQKEVVKDFLTLRASGLIPRYVTLGDLKEWIISTQQNIIKERFQIEESGSRDGLVYLTWEVNIRLKLLEIERVCKRVCGSQSPALPGGQDPRLAALRDLQSENPGILPPSAFFHCHFTQLQCAPAFNARAVVQQAIQDIIHKLAYQPASRQQSLSDVVVEVVAGLCQAITDEDGAEREIDARLLSSIAVGTAVSVLHTVRDHCPLAMEFSQAAKDGMVAGIHAELQRSMGTPQALKAALRTRKACFTTAITTAVTSAIRELCSGSHAFSSSSEPLPEIREEAIAGSAEEEQVAEKEDDVLEPQLDNEETQGPSSITSAPTGQLCPVEHASPSTDIETMGPGKEAVIGSTESMKVEVDVMELGTLQDPCAVDEHKEALGDVEVIYQPGDLPQKVKKKSAVRRFFGRVWKAMKCAVCCCGTVGEE